MKILFIDTAHPVLKSLFEDAGHESVMGTGLTRSEILSVAGEYDGVIIRSRILLDKEFIDCATRLKFIGRVGAGMECIDTAYAEANGIVCLNSPEGSRDAVGEHSLGMLLMLFNNLNKADAEVREGKWIREGNRGVELSGKTVGIIGYGNMGSCFAKKLSGFDCRVIAYDKFRRNFSDPYAKEVSMDEIYADTDVLSLHVPLTNETEFMVGTGYIQRFRKNIYLINTARGRCVKTDELVEGIKNGKISGACLDVNEFEDTSFEQVSNPGALPESWNYLIHSPKVVLTPHIAGWTQESNEKLARILAEKILSRFPAEG